MLYVTRVEIKLLEIIANRPDEEQPENIVRGRLVLIQQLSDHLQEYIWLFLYLRLRDRAQNSAPDQILLNHVLDINFFVPPDKFNEHRDQILEDALVVLNGHVSEVVTDRLR